MVRLREMTLERDGFGVREMVLLVTALSVVAAIAGFVLARHQDQAPAGIIGYRDGEAIKWVTTDGDSAIAPRQRPPAPFTGLTHSELGLAQFPSPDGKAIAFVNTTDEGPWFVSRLMVQEGGRVTEVGQLVGGESPPVLLPSKAAARSRDGVPLLVRWSPDGSKLAWGSLADVPYVLHIAERGSWKTQTVEVAGGYVGELSWSPDGRYLAVSTYAKDRADHTLLVLDVLDPHGEPKQLAKGCVVVWAPDSRHLALHGEPRTQPGLLVASIHGEVRQVINDSDVAPFAWVAE